MLKGTYNTQNSLCTDFNMFEIKITFFESPPHLVPAECANGTSGDCVLSRCENSVDCVFVSVSGAADSLNMVE